MVIHDIIYHLAKIFITFLFYTFQSTEGYLELWNLFQRNALLKLKEANKGGFKHNVVVWTSELAKANVIQK